ncbi:MAG TPA: hypothetical protein VK053_00820 [Jiangellaceae bacterium]|nr:hypothetical protein [Jiangellaceae bacterium]
MHAPHRCLARASAGAAVVTLIAACGGQGDEQSALPEAGSNQQDESSSPSSPHAPPTEPTAGSRSSHQQRTDGSGEQSLPSEYPDAGLSYDLPETSDAEAAALQAMLTFESERREATRGSLQVSEELESVATEDVVADIEDGLDYQRENGITYTGEITGTVTVEHVSEFDARVVACHDNSEVALQIEGEGEQPVEPREDGAEEAELVFELSKPQGAPFQVTSYQEGDPC